MTFNLSADSIAAYRRDGVTVLRGIYDRAAIDRIHADIETLFRIQAEQTGFRSTQTDPRRALHEHALHLITTDVPRYIATARTTQDLPSVHRLLTAETTTDIARALGIDFPIISTRASVHLMADDLKVPNGYHKSPPHQDWRSIQGSLDNVVLWIPMTPVSRTSNALEVVRGSHLYGLLPTSEHIQTPQVDDPRVCDADFEPLPVERGDAIVFSAFLVHRTGDVGDNLVRIALSTRFNNALEPTYVERGYASPYTYRYRLDLITPDFPPAADVAALFAEPVA